jgi:hypothetical protein
MQYTFFKDNTTLELVVTEEGRFVRVKQTGTMYNIGSRAFTLDLAKRLVIAINNNNNEEVVLCEM